jgi:exopolysaccharide biosynthesis polyprenyl glycosylphosphotransferase
VFGVTARGAGIDARLETDRLSAERRVGETRQLKGRGWWRDALRRRVLAASDAVAVLLGAIVIDATAGADAAFWAAALLPIWVLLAKAHGLYDRDHRTLRHLTVDEIPALLSWVTAGTVATTMLLALLPAGAPDFPSPVWFWTTVAVSAIALRGAARYAWRRATSPERTIIVGDGPLADATRRKLQLFPDIHVEIVDARGDITARDACADETLVGLDRVILAASSIDEEDIRTLVTRCRESQVKLTVIPPIRGMFGTAVQLRHVADLPLIEYNTWDVSRSTLLLKRVTDLIFTSVALTVAIPLSALIAIAIRIDSPGPVFFSQIRAGQGGRPFRIFKFRTMVTNAEELLPKFVEFDNLNEPMFKLRNDPRLTRVGTFLRRTSLDELPQLFNVLRGDMTLVGPRPEQIELVERYGPDHRFRLAVKPGVTGPMQVFGRGELSFDERLAVEREYIENLSVGRDLRMLALTLPAVFLGRGSY